VHLSGFERRGTLLPRRLLYLSLALYGALSQEARGGEQIYAQVLERHPAPYVGRWRAEGIRVQLLNSGRFSIEQPELPEGGERGYWWVETRGSPIETRGGPSNTHLCLTAGLEVICYQITWVASRPSPSSPTSPTSDRRRRPSMKLTLSQNSSITLHLELDSTPRASPNIEPH
jgi:hypothetical protein